MAYITKRGGSYGVRYTYQYEHGKNRDKRSEERRVGK